jgi:molybdopterin converting factor small subunit
MKNIIATTLKSPQPFNAEPLLAHILKEAEQEHRELQETFIIMGWRDLPDALKIEIKDDVRAMVDELEGKYSTCDPYVLQRRESITYWVAAFQDEICSLQTAIEALRVSKL